MCYSELLFANKTMYLASLCRSRSYITRGMSHLTAMRVSPPLHTTSQASNVSGYLASTSERSFWEHVLLYFLLFSSWNPDPTWVPLIGRAQDTHTYLCSGSKGGWEMSSAFYLSPHHYCSSIGLVAPQHVGSWFPDQGSNLHSPDCKMDS